MGPLKIDTDILVPEADTMKYLGVTLDRHLKWDVHASEVTNKVRSLLSKFKRLKEFLDL